MMANKVLDFLDKSKLELGPPGTAAAHHWRQAEDDGIVWLVLDCPDSPVNIVSEEVLTGLDAALRKLAETVPRALVIRSAKPGGFAAGADIDSFDRISGESAIRLLEQGHAVLDRLEALPCPTIAVIHGAALGAGFEIALACDHRIAIDGAKFAFPEVNLGLHPGLGGTFRLTGLIDPVEAMTLMLTGKSAHTQKAKKLGIVDIVTQERHVRAAVGAVVDGKIDPPAKGLKARAFALRKLRSLAAARMRAEAEKKAPPAHFPAPYALIDLWEIHGNDPEAMQKAEIASFAGLLDSETSRNLRRVFFLRRSLKKDGGGDDGISHVHVIGAGEMGAGIAGWAAIRGKRVTLGDISPEALARAIRQVAQICRDSHLNSIETRDALDRLMPDPKGYGYAGADLVIEAVPEDADLKAKIHREAGARMKPGAILATNTSSLALAELAKSVPDPARFAGLHFFNPVAKMQLVEIVSHDRTAPDTADRLAAFCASIDRLPAALRDYPGFLVNRALTPYLMEAMVLMDEGVPKVVIDRAALDFGMPMGPVTLADQVGLDICLDVAESLKSALDKPMPDISPRLREKVEAGETGKKAGRGFYDWSNGAPHPQATEAGPEDLQDRLILPMLDACMECLRMNVVRNADQVDGAMIFATGFAPFRGGPMHYARTRGFDRIRDRLAELADRHGERFRPDPGWDE
ncbi:3-hydroxyacyl-CoA dehydrogenase NAD-binding domain-containing protein [Paracoccus onubensis]|nr:3-hydroxyacyl-CoA dehydrogenase NAD-binding domain-containing protein [Paracoccus onubensis]